MKGLLSQVSTLESSFDIGKFIPGQPQTTTENNTAKSDHSFEEPCVQVSTLIDNLTKIDLTTQTYAINHLIDLMDWPKEETMSIINSTNMEGKTMMFSYARFDHVRYLQKHTKAIYVQSLMLLSLFREDIHMLSFSMILIAFTIV